MMGSTRMLRRVGVCFGCHGLHGASDWRWIRLLRHIQETLWGCEGHAEYNISQQFIASHFTNNPSNRTLSSVIAWPTPWNC